MSADQLDDPPGPGQDTPDEVSAVAAKPADTAEPAATGTGSGEPGPEITDHGPAVVAEATPLLPNEATPPRRWLSGPNYLDVLEQIGRDMSPARYLEIGTNKGASLRRIGCRSIAVDPDFLVDGNVIGTKPACLFYQMSSDAFFADHDAGRLLGGPVDLAFLDGMHRFEFLLRDFMGTERAARHDSVILMHDCFPLDTVMAERTYDPCSRPGYAEAMRAQDYDNAALWWTGDVWKVLWILAEVRPELIVTCIDAAPTGLVAVTGLDPASTALATAYERFVDRYVGIETTQEVLDEHYRRFALVGFADAMASKALAHRFTP